MVNPMAAPLAEWPAGVCAFWSAVVFVFGAVVGSFLNVCIHRLPREQSIIRPASHCPHCGQKLRWYQNIPLLSWLALRGRCAFCGKPISARYFIVELLNATLWALLWLKFGWSVEFFVYAVLVSLFLIGMFVDFEHYILPDEVTLGGAVLGLVLSGVWPQLQNTASWTEGLWRSLVGLTIGGGLLFFVRWFGGLLFGRKVQKFEKDVTLTLDKGRIRLDDGESPEEENVSDVLVSRRDRLEFQATGGKVGGEKIEGLKVKITSRELAVGGQTWAMNEAPRLEATARAIEMPREAMGLGDVKLMMAIGAFCGWLAVLFSLVVSSVLGALVGILLIVVRLRQWGGHIPYGPYIIVGAFLWIFFGPDIVRWYFDKLF